MMAEPEIAQQYFNQSVRMAVRDHPGLMGMLCHLPPHGEPWTFEQRHAWINAFMLVLDWDIATIGPTPNRLEAPDG